MDSSISLELVFNEAEFQVLVPNCSSDDYKDILSSKPRSFTFFDEQLKVYLLARVPYQISGTGDDVRDTIRSFFNQLDVHVEASNLDGSSAQPPTASPFSPSLQHRSLSTKLTSSAPSSPKMHHKRENSRGPFTATTATAPESLPFFSQTFNTRGNDAEPIFYEQDEAYCCLYPFIIPILYVKTRSTNPLISITYNISYRPMPQSTKKKDDDYDDDEKDGFDNDAFETIDLLSGLAEDPVFSSVENSLHQRFVVEKHSRQPSGSFGSNSPSSSQMLTLRRHVRETLCVRSGLNVKMRTTNASVVDKMVMMSVELENTVDAGCEFIVDKVDVMVSNSVVTMTSAKQDTFPINLKTMDQMVLLYNVTLLEDGSAKPPTQPTRIFPTRNRPALPSLPPIPPQDDRLQPQRVSIQVYGSPVIDGIRTLPMRSKWNTMLDVSGMRQKREEHDPRFSSLLNSSGGSGGPSYLTRSSASKSTSVSASPGARSVGSPMSQIAYSDGMTAAAAGGKKRMVLATAARDGGGPGAAAAAAAARRTEMEVADGIIISFTVPSTIVVGKVFLLKIFIVNRSKHTRRFLVMVPNRKRQHQPPPAPDVKSNLPPLPIEQQPVEPYMDEAEFLRQYFENETHEADILCLENNVRLSPLGPSTSQSVDIRFIAVKENLHTIDLIQLVDQDTGFVTNLRQVLEIFVNPRPIE